MSDTQMTRRELRENWKQADAKVHAVIDVKNLREEEAFDLSFYQGTLLRKITFTSTIAFFSLLGLIVSSYFEFITPADISQYFAVSFPVFGVIFALSTFFAVRWNKMNNAIETFNQGKVFDFHKQLKKMEEEEPVETFSYKKCDSCGHTNRIFEFVQN